MHRFVTFEKVYVHTTPSSHISLGNLFLLDVMADRITLSPSLKSDQLSRVELVKLIANVMPPPCATFLELKWSSYS